MTRQRVAPRQDLREKAGAPEKRLTDAFARLVACASESALATNGPEVREGLIALILRSAAARVSGAALGSGARTTVRAFAEELSESHHFLALAGLSSPALADPAAFALADPKRLSAWLDDDTINALVEAVIEESRHGAATDLGGHYQSLLAVGVRRLEATSICVEPSRTWVAAKDVLAAPAATRSKWLQSAATMPKSTVQRLASQLSAAKTEDDVLTALSSTRARGTKPARPGHLVLDASVDRRRSGSHYTPVALARAVIERALGPLVATDNDAILSLRICDPSMGSGAFLLETARFLAERLVQARRLDRSAADSSATALEATARRDVVTHCLYGVDKDPIAVDLARWALARFATNDGQRPPDLSLQLRVGDALVGKSLLARNRDEPIPSVGVAPFDWPREFSSVLAAGGFDACLGNPPWVAYVGRAAQPLEPALSRYYERTNPAFFGYRSLHGLFVRRAAEMLREGGRLGLVVPTSVADLSGYAPTRRAHDELCDADPDLTDFGNGAFENVFQPCMALTSTRRRADAPMRAAAIWQLQRTDLDAASTGLLARLAELPALPASLFGERGFQTTGTDLANLRRLSAAEPPFVVPIREGSDVAEFAVRAPEVFLDPSGLRGRFRAIEDWQQIGVLIRQTARYPIAALADATPFRNSLLAGFASDDWTPHALVAYLNSSLVRWHHYAKYRDARQGMPQVKIGHLRGIPAVQDPTVRTALDAMGRRLGNRNTGIDATERDALDDVVFDAFELPAASRTLVRAWMTAHPPPRSRDQRR